ncbi:hypothetical protein [Lentilactobacillus sp. Marseille-Q4993]|uniref:hypothetical protein n=1 Tax=Lentilactobacillus sp. Marseille-Q4993 TaxID=3039492 RepID=UPI0024BCDAF4|nr:hypothetical protein [Lentilactobacillus sp. Marseille-Q4993]
MDKHPRWDHLIEQVRVLNPNTPENPNYQTILDFVLDKVINDVANYTHIPILDLPEELDQTIIALCTLMITTHGLLVPLTNTGSLTEGDTSVTFKSPAEIYAAILKINPITDDYVMQLNQFRVVKRP